MPPLAPGRVAWFRRISVRASARGVYGSPLSAAGYTFDSQWPICQVRTLGRSAVMIGVFVTFRYGDNFDEQAVRKIAQTARAGFQGMPGLHSKAFTVNSGKREATHFYFWDSEDAARAFFTDTLLKRVTDLYGARPSVEFVQIATLVENA